MNTHIKDILKILPLKNNARILDIGAGLNPKSFEVLEIVPDGQIILLEIDKNKLSSLLHKINQHKISGVKTQLHSLYFDVDNGNILPIRDSSLDLIIISHTLRHIIYRESLLKECNRLLVPGGLVLVTELHENAHFGDIHPDTRINPDDMLEYLDNAGFLIGDNFDTHHNEYGIIGVCPVSR